MFVRWFSEWCVWTSSTSITWDVQILRPRPTWNCQIPTWNCQTPPYCAVELSNVLNKPSGRFWDSLAQVWGPLAWGRFRLNRQPTQKRGAQMTGRIRSPAGQDSPTHLPAAVLGASTPAPRRARSLRSFAGSSGPAAAGRGLAGWNDGRETPLWFVLFRSGRNNLFRIVFSVFLWHFIKLKFKCIPTSLHI